MDLSILQYECMQNAIPAGCLGSAACSLIDVPVVTMNLSFIGAAIARAAFAGALPGALPGFSPEGGRHRPPRRAGRVKYRHAH